MQFTKQITGSCENRTGTLQKWVNRELENRFRRLTFFDPWELYDIPQDNFLNEYQFMYEYLDKQDQDQLVTEIYRKFHNYKDVDCIRTLLTDKCRFMLTNLELHCLGKNLHRLILWCIKNVSMQRQLERCFAKRGLPSEMISEIFHYIFPLPQPPVVHVHDYETYVTMRYIERPDLRLRNTNVVSPFAENSDTDTDTNVFDVLWRL